MASNQDIETGENYEHEEITSPLLSKEKRGANGDDDQDQSKTKTSKEDRSMVYFSTFVAVCGSYAFGSGAGYSSPAQSSITQDLGLSLPEYSLFVSVLSFGAMIGAITSGKIADHVGRKRAMVMSSAFCTAGWLAIYFAKVLFRLLGQIYYGTP